MNKYQLLISIGKIKAFIRRYGECELGSVKYVKNVLETGKNSFIIYLQFRNNRFCYINSCFDEELFDKFIRQAGKFSKYELITLPGFDDCFMNIDFLF